jgi:hypothetical protein
MFRMIPGVEPVPTSDRPSGPGIGTLVGLVAVLAVSSVGLIATAPEIGPVAPGETELAQRSAAVVADAYRADVAIDRRDRMLLVSYDDGAVMSADRFAWTVCDTIRTAPDTAISARVLRDWQVVTMPTHGMPGSCRIGVLR